MIASFFTVRMLRPQMQLLKRVSIPALLPPGAKHYVSMSAAFTSAPQRSGSELITEKNWNTQASVYTIKVESAEVLKRNMNTWNLVATPTSYT